MYFNNVIGKKELKSVLSTIRNSDILKFEVLNTINTIKLIFFNNKITVTIMSLGFY